MHICVLCWHLKIDVLLRMVEDVTREKDRTKALAILEKVGEILEQEKEFFREKG